jgi:hypothetical protein
MSFAASERVSVGDGGMFGQVMGLVAATLGLLTLGAYLGRHLSGGASLVFLILTFVLIFGLNFVRNSGAPAVGLLFGAGLSLGLGLGGTLDASGCRGPRRSVI